eukprot:8972413-Alexandrium_andersonii.AAC.1
MPSDEAAGDRSGARSADVPIWPSPSRTGGGQWGRRLRSRESQITHRFRRSSLELRGPRSGLSIGS